MSVMDWTGGLIQRPDVPISVMRLPARVHRIEDDDELPEYVAVGRRADSLMARVKTLIGRHGRISTRELLLLLPNDPPKSVMLAARNLSHLKEIRSCGREPRSGSRGNGPAIWELAEGE